MRPVPGLLGLARATGAYADNLTDTICRADVNALDHRIGTTTSICGAPRMFGVELRRRFGNGAEAAAGWTLRQLRPFLS